MQDLRENKETEMKTIDTLVYDIHEYLKGNHASIGGEVDPETDLSIVQLAKNIAVHTLRLSDHRPVEARKTEDVSLRMSEIGEPCLRKLLYKRYHPNLGLPPFAEPGPPTLQVKFLLGHYVEEIVLFLAEQSGHAVTERQTELRMAVPGTPWHVEGHPDCVIDGHVIDVKSASDFSFNKYKREGMLVENDTFGYRYQIDGYATCLGLKERGFIFCNKHDGELLFIDRSDKDLIDIPQRIRDIGQVLDAYISNAEVPSRMPTVVDKKLGEQKLGTVCSYCPFKTHCWQDEIQGYIISGKPVYLVNESVKGRLQRADSQKISCPTP